MKEKVELTTISKKGIDIVQEGGYYVANGLLENGDYTIYAEDAYRDKISYEENKLNNTVSGSWLQKVKIYIKYEYEEEVRPGEFEKRYASKLYKTMFSRDFD